jgi:hypothetical protein
VSHAHARGQSDTQDIVTEQLKSCSCSVSHGPVRHESSAERVGRSFYRFSTKKPRDRGATGSSPLFSEAHRRRQLGSSAQRWRKGARVRTMRTKIWAHGPLVAPCNFLPRKALTSAFRPRDHETGVPRQWSLLDDKLCHLAPLPCGALFSGVVQWQHLGDRRRGGTLATRRGFSARCRRTATKVLPCFEPCRDLAGVVNTGGASERCQSGRWGRSRNLGRGFRSVGQLDGSQSYVGPVCCRRVSSDSPSTARMSS